MRIIIFVTAKNKAEARKVAGSLVKGKLAACVNIIAGVESVFRWQGKIDSAKEIMLVIKSRKDKLQRIIKAVKKVHSYHVPEIIAMPIIGGFEPYLKWIDDSVRRT